LVHLGEIEDFLEPLKNAFKEKRLVLREFSYDGNKPNGIDAQIEQAKAQFDQTVSTIIRWCQVHYGEIYSGLIHLKVIRAFIESVLRYGLPINFASMFLEPNMQKEKQVKMALISAISQLRPELSIKKLESEEEEDGDDSENLPFVCQKFNVIGATEK
jgi:V-type H+-transporting ATPase subunit C